MIALLVVVITIIIIIIIIIDRKDFDPVEKRVLESNSRVMWDVSGIDKRPHLS